MTDLSSADSPSDTRPTPPPDRPTLGYEISEDEVCAAVGSILPILEAQPRPAYIVDMNLVVQKANSAMLRMLGLSDDAGAMIEGVCSTNDLLFDGRLGVRQFFPEEIWKNYALEQFDRMQLLWEPRVGKAVVARYINWYRQRFPAFDQLWRERERLNQPPSLSPRSHVELEIQSRRLSFDVITDMLLNNPKFFVVEYHPTNDQTQSFLQTLLRKDIWLSPSDLSSALRAWNDLAGLQRSPVGQLGCVTRVAKQNNLSQAEALKDILRDAIEACAPDRLTGETRSKPRIKYEILRMTAYESATEEQIMWDLGFEPEHDLWANGNPDKARSPRYPYRGKGDYGATSRASFKRLKNQALDDLAWQLEQREK